MAKLKHVRIEAGHHVFLTRIFVDGEQVTNVVAYRVEGDIRAASDRDGLTYVTMTFIPDSVEIDSDEKAGA